jgi:hypothetical protein
MVEINSGGNSKGLISLNEKELAEYFETHNDHDALLLLIKETGILRGKVFELEMAPYKTNGRFRGNYE